MQLISTNDWLSARIRLSSMSALNLLLVFLAGCPAAVPPNGNSNTNTNGNGNGDTGVSGEVLNFSTDVGISLLAPALSVIFSMNGAPDTISGYYVPVDGNSASALPIGDRVVVATDLPAGTDQAFNFDPQIAGQGFYRVGILWTVGNLQDVAESSGIIQVQGPPDPAFVLPANAVTTVTQGDDVFISFDAGDPEGDVRWRLFYLAASDPRDVSADQLGTQIGTGSGNFGSATLSTSTLLAGDYELGVAATDSGLSVAATVANGEEYRVIVTASGPIIRVTAP